MSGKPLPGSTAPPEPFQKVVVIVSIVIPLIIAALFGVKIEGYDFSFLPPIYATINGLTAFVLILAFLAIKNGSQRLHENLMKTCMILSCLFLVMYVLYHMTSKSTPFGGEGTIRYVYFFILISHILLSIAVIPLVLFTYLRAWRGDFARHRKLAKIAFPIWLYVAISGVVVYLMISPYYS
jgi:putative membrane protein